MRRVPVLATILVLAAVATMIGLGIWQIERARWKEGLLASYTAAQGQPLLSGLPNDAVRDPDRYAFRRAELRCVPTGATVQIGGRGRDGVTGYRQINACRLPQGGIIMVDRGILPPGQRIADVPGANPAAFAGRGVLIPDPVLAKRVTGVDVPLLLVADAPPVLKPSVPPSIADIPNNHRAYAVQWFLFAATALIVYLLALRGRRR